MLCLWLGGWAAEKLCVHYVDKAIDVWSRRDLIEHILSFLYNKFLLFVINSAMNPDISITASKVWESSSPK